MTRDSSLPGGVTGDAPIPSARPAPDDEQASESASRTVPSERPGDRGPPSRLRLVASVAVVLGVVLLLAFAPLSGLVGRPPAPSPALPTDLGKGPKIPGVSSGIQVVPAGLPAGTRIHTLADVRAYAVAALGPAGADTLTATLNGPVSLNTTVAGIQNGIGGVYPYRYPSMETLLDAVPPDGLRSGGTALGAALTVLAAERRSPLDRTHTLENAAPAAFAVLDRVRAGGACAPQLDLLLLLAGDGSTDHAIVAREQRQAEGACPHDATPAWLVGQAQLHNDPVTVPYSPPGMGRTSDGATTMARLVNDHPTGIGALTGLGDAYLAAGLRLNDSEPFTARRYLRQAVDAYQRAVRQGGHHAAAPGLARALIMLGDPSEAIPLLAPYVGSSPSPGPFLEMLIAAQEAAHRYADAQSSARRLADLGTQAYPDGNALIPVPVGSDTYDVNTLKDRSLALSLGADRLRPLDDMLIGAGGAGGGVDNVAFIPPFRDAPGLTGTNAACASWTWRRDAVLAGHPADALQSWSGVDVYVRPSWLNCNSSDALQAVAEFLTVGRKALQNGSSDTPADDWQNLLRWAGDLPRARTFVGDWESVRGDSSYLPALRAGEIAFLQRRFDDAAAEFDLAGRRARLVQWNDDLTVARAGLDRGAALKAGGRTAEAEAALRPLVTLGVQGFSYNKTVNGNSTGFATVSYHSSAQLADQERESGQLRAAVEDYTAALSWEDQLHGLPPDAHLEALDNNAALAHLGLGDTARAAALETAALNVDPQNSVFLMTAGFIADRRNATAEAVRWDRAALQSDPGAYPVANDLGVELARQGHDAQAREALRQAVGARPDYALGWFNLGVLESSMGPTHLLAAQHAFGTAYGLDPALRDRRHELTIDGKVYRTALDVSKPLPPGWSFAQLQRPAPVAAVGLLALLGVAVGLARSADRGGTEIAGTWLDAGTRRLEKLPLTARFRHAGWALLATVAAFVFAALHRSTDPTALVVYALGVLVLSATVMTVREVIARRAGVALTQRSWLPGILLGLATGAAGFPWAPLPVVETETEDDAGIARVHLAAPVTLAVISLLLFLEFVWAHTPLVQWWALASLIMSASMLLPVGPLDGAHVGKAGIAAGAGVVATAVLVAVGLL